MLINGRGVLQSRAKFPKDFCESIAHLKACPSFSAATENVFSNFSFVHSKIQNWLTISNTSKLVFCYGMLKRELFCNNDGNET